MIQTKNLEATTLNLEKINEQIEKAQAAVLAPIDGVVTDINALEGSIVTAMQPVMTIVDMSDLKIVADLREYDVKDIALDQPVVIEGDAIMRIVFSTAARTSLLLVLVALTLSRPATASDVLRVDVKPAPPFIIVDDPTAHPVGFSADHPDRGPGARSSKAGRCAGVTGHALPSGGHTQRPGRSRHRGHHDNGRKGADLRFFPSLFPVQPRYPGARRHGRLRDLAAAARMSESSLLATFKEATGQSPIDYLIHLRIQRAAEQLRHNTQSISEIAYSVGFEDSNYFSRQFRKTMQSSPRDYRRRFAVC